MQDQQVNQGADVRELLRIRAEMAAALRTVDEVLTALGVQVVQESL